MTSLLSESEEEKEADVAVAKAPASKAAGKGKVAAKSKVAPKTFKVGLPFVTQQRARIRSLGHYYA